MDVTPPQQRLYFLPEPHGHGSFLPVLPACTLLCGGRIVQAALNVPPSLNDPGYHLHDYFFPLIRSNRWRPQLRVCTAQCGVLHAATPWQMFCRERQRLAEEFQEASSHRAQAILEKHNGPNTPEEHARLTKIAEAAAVLLECARLKP